MNNLVIMKDQQAVTSSLQVAENFEKEHKNILRDIESLKKDVLNFEQMFYETTTPDSYGRERKTYLINREGFTLLAMGFTGKKALEFKLAYIEAFNNMEKYITSQQLPMSQEDIMIATLETQKELKTRINTVSNDVEGLKKEIDLSRNQKAQLSKLVRKNAMQAVVGKKSQAYKTLYRKAIAEHWREIKNYFEVTSYEEIPKIKFEEAMEIAEMWKPSMELAYEIKKANTQIKLEV